MGEEEGQENGKEKDVDEGHEASHYVVQNCESWSFTMGARFSDGHCAVLFQEKTKAVDAPKDRDVEVAVLAFIESSTTSMRR